VTIDKKRDGGVLRGVATHANPRHLPRSPRQGFVPASPVVHAAVDAAPPTPAQAGYREGLELGRAAGLQQGLEGAQQRVDEAVKAARVEFEEAAKQRLEQFKAEAGARLAQLEQLLAAFESASARRVAELESDAIALAYGAVCKVLGTQAASPAAIAGLVQQAMAQLRGSAIVAVRMNERDLRALLNDDQGRRLRAAAPQVEWIADAAVAAGGCLVDTTAGSLDARLETQLAALQALWRGDGAGTSA
jgi:flagellar assembly protein FliH